MLEWYRKNEKYEKIMDDCENLIQYIQNHFNITEKINSFQRSTVQDVFQEYCNFLLGGEKTTVLDNNLLTLTLGLYVFSGR